MITLTVGATGLPTGLSDSFSDTTRVLTISGTVDLGATAQDYTVTITADDAVNAAVTNTFTIKVDAGIVVTPTTLSNVFDAATGVLNSDVTSGDEITFEAGTYTDVGALTVDTPVTLIGNTGTWVPKEEKTDPKFPGVWNIAGAVVRGAVRLIITSSGVTVKGFVFKDTTGGVLGYSNGIVNPQGSGLSGITIEKNEFNNTHTHGFYFSNSGGASGFTIEANRFVNIGYNDTPLAQLRNKQTAIYANHMADSSITKNHIENTTWAGINLGNLSSPLNGFTISDNTIDGVSKNGIQIGGSLNANTTISGNTINNANNDLTRVELYSKYGAAGTVVEIISGGPANPNDSIPNTAVVRFIDPNVKAAISIDGSSVVTIENNTLTNNHDGIIICPDNCDINHPHTPLSTDPVNATSAVVTNNKIHSNSAVTTVGATLDDLQGDTKDLSSYDRPQGTGLISGSLQLVDANGSPQLVDARNNYWGSALPTFQTGGSVAGNVNYEPWYETWSENAGFATLRTVRYINPLISRRAASAITVRDISAPTGYQLSGPDADKFTISSSGRISANADTVLNAAPFEVTVTVSDSLQSSSIKVVLMTVPTNKTNPSLWLTGLWRAATPGSSYAWSPGDGSGGYRSGDAAELETITPQATGDEATIFIPETALRSIGVTTLNDLDTIEWSASDVVGYTPHVDVALGNGEHLVFEYRKLARPPNCDDTANYPTGPVDTFGFHDLIGPTDKGIADGDAYAWLVPGPAGGCDTDTFVANHLTLIQWKAEVRNDTAYGDLEVVSIYVEIDNWIPNLPVYGVSELSSASVSGIAVNGKILDTKDETTEEYSDTTNQPSEVSVSMTDPVSVNVNDTVTLTAEASDDLTSPSNLMFAWSQISGPGVGTLTTTTTATLDKATAIATFTAPTTLAATDKFVFSVIVGDGRNDIGRLVTFYPGICGRTPQVADGILAAVSPTECTEVKETDLAGITTPLNLSTKNITELKSGDFAGLTSLQSLNLEANRLEALPEGVIGVFDELTGLKKLYLDRNWLNTLPEQVFAKNTALEELSLNGNLLESLDDDVFDGLTKLWRLWFGENQLTKLPANIVRSDPSTSSKTLPTLLLLRDVSIGSNPLGHLPDGFLKELPAGLEYLSLGARELHYPSPERGPRLTSNDVDTIVTHFTGLKGLRVAGTGLNVDQVRRLLMARAGTLKELRLGGGDKMSGLVNDESCLPNNEEFCWSDLSALTTHLRSTKQVSTQPTLRRSLRASTPV